jgi:hypothetical protein
MSQVFEIPLTPAAQSLRTSLNGVYYNLTLVWNSVSNNWNLDIEDDLGNNILCGLPLVSGINLLDQLGYLGFSGFLVAQTDNDTGVPPTYNNLGSHGHLYFVVL